MGSPRFNRSRQHKYVVTTADITVNTPAQTWQEVAAETGGPGSGLLDMALDECQEGDVILASMVGFMTNASVDTYFDFKSMVSGSPVSSWVAAGTNVAVGNPSGPLYAIAGVYMQVAGGLRYTLQAGDIVDGLVTIRPFVATYTAVSRAIYNRAQFAVENIGPAQG